MSPKMLLHFALLSGITFCVNSYYNYFVLTTLFHLASKFITFRVTFTFCAKSYYNLCYYYILWRNNADNILR